MKRIEVYMAIIIVGTVIGIVMTVDSNNLAYLVLSLYVGIYLIGTIRWLDEFFYYRRWDSPLASSMFVGIPLILGFLGGIMAIHSPVLNETFFSFTITLDFIVNDNIVIFISHFSLVLLTIPYVISFFLLQRWIRLCYHPVYVFRRPVHPQVLSVLFLITMMGYHYLLWKEGYPLEGLGLITMGGLISLSIYRFLRHFVPRSRRSQRQRRHEIIMEPSHGRTTRSNSRTTQPILVNTTPRTTTPDRTRSSSHTTRRISRTTRTSERGRRPSGSRARRPHAIRGQNDAVTNARSSRSTARSESSRSSRPSRTPRGEPRVTSPSQMPSTPTSKKMRPILPRTRVLSKDDFNCMLCFQPPSKKDEPLVLCPHCHFPAHLSEWQEWHQATDICSRCNEKIPKSYLKNPKHVVPAKIYLSWRKATR